MSTTTYEKKWDVLKGSVQNILDGYVKTFSDEIRLQGGVVGGSTTAYQTVLQLMSTLETETVSDGEYDESINPYLLSGDELKRAEQRVSA